jgi:molybdenum cofactor cytidylyltransferase
VVAAGDLLASLTGAALLAAGAGTRFDGPQHKLLTPVGGRPLIAYAVEHLVESRLVPVLVVTGATDVSAFIPSGIETAVNPDWAAGLATSLTVAVHWADGRGLDAIVIGLADQPSITADAWRAVAEADATPVAVATYHGRRSHPVRLAREVWSRLPSSGDRGARLIMAESPELVTEIACAGDPTDIDTVEDLNRWR